MMTPFERPHNTTAGTAPLYRHPADEQPAPVSWTPAVNEVRKAVEARLGVKLNHALVQWYRGGMDYISEHADKVRPINELVHRFVRAHSHFHAHIDIILSSDALQFYSSHSHSRLFSCHNLHLHASPVFGGYACCFR